MASPGLFLSIHTFYHTFGFRYMVLTVRDSVAPLTIRPHLRSTLYGHAPTMAHSCILPDFAVVWLITLWDYYWQTGSLEPFLAHQETIRGVLKYFEDKTDPETGLVGFDGRYWLFLDWAGLFKEGYSTVYNLWLLIALEKLASMSRAAGKLTEARKLSTWARRLRISLARLVREDDLLCDGLTFDRKPVKAKSIHSQTLAILANFQPEQNSKRIEKILLPFLRREITPDISPSCYWITYVFEAMTEAGYGAEVVDYIREKWGPMTAHGTTWEVFEPRVGDESFSHAWSAHPLYHLMQTIGGIRQVAAGWKEILFQPHFIGEEANITVPTSLGNIHSSWKRERAVIKMRLSLPEGISATVKLPGLNLGGIKGDFSRSLNTAQIGASRFNWTSQGPSKVLAL